MHRKQFTKPWKEFAEKWEELTSPGRPSVGEINIFEDFSKTHLKKDAKVLILGSTPELRDLAAKYHTQVTLVDLNLEMLMAMNQLCKIKNDQEIWVCASWIEAPLKNNYFDLILGDFVVSNVPFDLHDKLFTNICRWLKPKGLLISRIENLKVNQKMDEQEFISYFNKKPVDINTINEFWQLGCWSLIGSKTQEVKVKNLLSKIERWLKTSSSSKINKIMKCGGLLYPKEKSWYSYTEKDLYHILKKYFVIKQAKCSNDINYLFKDYAPIFKLKPRKE